MNTQENPPVVPDDIPYVFPEASGTYKVRANYGGGFSVSGEVGASADSSCESKYRSYDDSGPRKFTAEFTQNGLLISPSMTDTVEEITPENPLPVRPNPLKRLYLRVGRGIHSFKNDLYFNELGNFYSEAELGRGVRLTIKQRIVRSLRVMFAEDKTIYRPR